MMINFLIFLLGASIGSFVYAASIRLGLENETIMHRSRCRTCDRHLYWYELFPIISWIFQKGRCGCGKQKISSWYLWSEILLGILFLSIFLHLPPLDFIFIAWLVSCMFYFLMTDFLYQKLDLRIMILNMAIGLVYSSYLVGYISLVAITSASLGFCLMWLINYIYCLVKKRQGFGDGDKYLMASLGAWVTPIEIFSLLFISSWLALFLVIYLMFKKKVNLLTKIPLGVFIVLGFPVTFFIFRALKFGY